VETPADVGAARKGAAAAPVVQDPSPQRRAEEHYRGGLALFQAGNREQALVEFRMANQLFPSHDVVFMIAQCEYHLGRLKSARDNFAAYLAAAPAGPLAETARVRISAIDQRPSVLAITTVPSETKVRIERLGPEPYLHRGEAPNEFEVRKGRYRIDVSKPNFKTESRELDVGLAEMTPLFFQLERVPGRLRVATSPPQADLYVRGMRAENPYDQALEPGKYEIYSEAANHRSRRETVEVRSGGETTVDFRLTYVQRSGRPELIGFWSVIGGVIGGGLVFSELGPEIFDLTTQDEVRPTLLTAVGAGAGAAVGGLVATRFTPDYIPDNKALFRIGATWIGALQGVTLALAIDDGDDDKIPWLGGLLGLGLGAIGGTQLDRYAPNYGRVAMIQSAAAAGFLGGLLASSAFSGDEEEPLVTTDASADEGNPTALSSFVGLNIGLAAGLAMAYLPDQSVYGPTWQRIFLIDLAGLAGALAGATIGTLESCTSTSCNFQDTPTTMKLALAGGLLGLGAGYLLTLDYDQKSTERHRTSVSLAPGAMPLVSADGRVAVAPGLVAAGWF
jgi:hypothetical protein